MRVVVFLLILGLGVVGLRTAFDKVSQEIASPNPSRLDFHGTPVPPPDFSAMNKLMAKSMPDVQNDFSSNIVQQNQQFNNRMEDLRNYARNPAGWHGPPPH